jgi:hypothetical protein
LSGIVIPGFWRMAADKETFADVWREIVGDRTQRDVARLVGVSHTYFNSWLARDGTVPAKRTLMEAVRRLMLKGELRARVWKAAGYVDPEPPDADASADTRVREGAAAPYTSPPWQELAAEEELNARALEGDEELTREERELLRGILADAARDAGRAAAGAAAEGFLAGRRKRTRRISH